MLSTATTRINNGLRDLTPVCQNALWKSPQIFDVSWIEWNLHLPRRRKNKSEQVNALLAGRIINTSRISFIRKVRKSITDFLVFFFWSVCSMSIFFFVCLGLTESLTMSGFELILNVRQHGIYSIWPWARSSDKCQFAFDLQMFFWLPLIAPPPPRLPLHRFPSFQLFPITGVGNCHCGLDDAVQAQEHTLNCFSKRLVHSKKIIY